MRSRSVAIVLTAIFSALCAYVLGRVQGAPSTVVAVVPASNPQASSTSAGTKKPPKPKPIRGMGAILPSDTQPLRETFSDLQARAAAGDVAAATQLYRGLATCRALGSMDSENAGMSGEILERDVGAMDSSQLESYQAELEAVEGNRLNMDRLHRLCDGVTNGMYDNRYWAVQKAAELGDPYARACVLQRGPSSDMRAFANQPQLLDAYRAQVPNLIRSGIAAGDWRVIEILRDAYQPEANSLLGGVLGSDPVQRYRYLKLYGLGSDSHAGSLDAELHAAAADLTPAQLSEADAWAHDTFQRDFRGNTVTSADVVGGDACAF